MTGVAARGAWLGRGYIRGFGSVSVFADDRNKDMFFVQKLRGRGVGERRYVRRDQLQWRK
jgi:hypothetical protein